MSQTENVTELLIAWNNGDPEALDQLMPLVETELRRLAGHFMRNEQPGNTLQPTALVNEAYLKLIDQRNAKWQNRAHFFAISARIMRRILIDHARTQARRKRGGDAERIDLSEVAVVTPAKSEELLALDDALRRLAEIDPVKSQVVELRYFGGLTVEETAEILKVAPITVIRYWNLAKAWLKREIRGELTQDTSGPQKPACDAGDS
jgi:RNA polymerase sigma factor (TIGR02999 family)